MPRIRRTKVPRRQRPITHICTTCGTEAAGGFRRRGNGAAELLLWVCFIVPGLVYTAWRNLGAKVRICLKCGHERMIPLSTPIGIRLHEELEPYRESTL